MTPHEITEALKLRRKGASDATIAAGMVPPVTRQHIHAALGPRKRKAAAPKPRMHATKISRADFAFALRAWRASRSISQVQAAALLHVNPPSLGFWEQERVGCSLAGAILRLMALLDDKDGRS